MRSSTLIPHNRALIGEIIRYADVLFDVMQKLLNELIVTQLSGSNTEAINNI